MVRSGVGSWGHVLDRDHCCVNANTTVVIRDRVGQGVGSIIVGREAEVFSRTVSHHIAIISRNFPQEAVRVIAARICEAAVQCDKVTFVNCLVRSGVGSWGHIVDGHHQGVGSTGSVVVSHSDRYRIGSVICIHVTAGYGTRYLVQGTGFHQGSIAPINGRCVCIQRTYVTESSCQGHNRAFECCLIITGIDGWRQVGHRHHREIAAAAGIIIG